MSHEQGREAVAAPQAFDQLMHLDAGQRVQGTQGFVQQQQARLVHQGPGQGHALALPARQASRPLLGALGQTDLGQHGLGTRALLGRQAQGHVVEHALPGQQARILEHDAGVGVEAVDGPAVDVELAPGGRLQAGHQAQQSALATAAAAHDGDKLAGFNAQVGLAQHFALAIAFGQAAQLEAHAARGGVG